MKIDLNFYLKNLDDKDISDEEQGHAGKLLGHRLAMDLKDLDAIKFYDWAKSLYRLQAIEIDRSDVDKLKKFINDCHSMTALAKAQILLSIKNSESLNTK